MSAAIIICQSVFSAIYIIADGAGTVPFLFILIKFAISLCCSYVLSIPLFNMLASDEK